ncbi:nuclear receptor subfamily 0 group B member 1-like [Cololabis saira]|uniref:nuclear receptor subfamily 0 group B member 1-like n=1 Tax=Cololabis saira TaxID=129043 RepID=UPI002AD499D6|nr:nuclear receptor subfamily 0 group B member 1-like [Cololabis saira]
MSCCDSGPSSILFSLLSRGPPRRLCACASSRPQVWLRSLRSPSASLCACAPSRSRVFQLATEELQSSFRFVRSLPSFRSLPVSDQLRLVWAGWARLLVLGLARVPVLRGIPTQHPGVPGGAAQRLQLVLDMCAGLRTSVREDAFLRGALLFTADATELECGDYIQALQREAERALYEHVRTIHRDDPARLDELRRVLVTLRSLEPDTVAGLFFRPVTGPARVEDHVFAMFFKS